MENNFLFSNSAGYFHSPEINNYYKKIPFDPPEKYPELPFIKNIDKENRIYPMVRDVLQRLGMDKENYGTDKWNPFKALIKPGDKVVIKPNLVTDSHYVGGNFILSTIVHGSIIRPIIDYVYQALQGEGSIIIADNPIEPADFEKIMEITGIRKMVEVLKEEGYRNLKVIDLRPIIVKEGSGGEPVEIQSSGDPLGYITIDLGKDSCFAKLDANSNISYYTLEDKTIDHLDPFLKKKSMTDSYHNPGMHKYIISKTVLSADVIINVAKLKTHCKAGVTLSLKNLIGIVGGKVSIPHHRPGPPPDGDSFPNYPASYYVESRKIYRSLRKLLHIHKFPGVRSVINFLRRNKIIVGQQIEHGNWKGNDTIWRSILDINRIAVYADKNGVMQDSPQRRFFYIIDGIIGQEGDAPIGGTPKPCGVLISGFNPVVVDALGCKIMGIDYRLIPAIANARMLKRWRLCAVNVDLSFDDIKAPNLMFKLPKGWR